MGKFIHFLLTYDTSLGIDYREGQLYLIKIRKTLYGYKILKQQAIETSTDGSPSENLLKLNEIISENHLTATYLNWLFPLEKCLIKKVRIPIMAESEILNFLYQNHDLYLDVTIDMNNMELRYYKVSQSSEEYELLIILYWKDHRFSLPENHADRSPFVNQHLSGISLNYLIKEHYPGYTGLLIDLSGKTGTILSYSNGKLVDLDQCDPCDDTIPFTYSDLSENDGMVLFSGDNSVLSNFKAKFPALQIVSIKNVEPVYLQALSVSLIPFSETVKNVYPLSERDQKKCNEQFYKHLSKKALLLLGTPAFLAGLLSLFLIYFFIFLIGQKNEKSLPLQPMNDRLHLLQANHDRLLKELNIIRNRTSRRTYHGFYLLEISRVLPEDLWFEEIEFSAASGDISEYLIKGFSLTERSVNEFLAVLEKFSFCKSLLLDQLAVVEEKSKKENSTVYQFQVRFYV